MICLSRFSRENILWNELILVVGTTKTDRWAIAVNVHEQAEASLAFVVRGTGVNAWGEWAGTVGFDKCSPHVGKSQQITMGFFTVCLSDS